ncbi:DUF2808 domain-containing protein [Anabaena sp. UHCC 0399]|uniref:DUF2808 domain-containing protein n=1 Tax=Anabaena sp. UHCC 0399 TaxID=3110238 RepID=UPI002B212815|nr:DUF2808 domain-containing protein [Anabaena sp. UHCC 0399]MEA5569396.1 DUF2808 domain-containing protein [Anabaena sp. UHCC 0399]
MKKLIWFSTVSLAIATTSLPAIAQTQQIQPGQQYQPGQTIQPGQQYQPGQPMQPGQQQYQPRQQQYQPGQPMSYDRTAPRISRTSGFRDTHYISVYTGEQPLSYVVVRPSELVSINNDNISITDQSGQNIDANISTEGDRIRINFAQPITPGSTLQIAFRNLAMDTPNRNFYLYELAGGHIGYRREIPYGFAQIQVF